MRSVFDQYTQPENRLSHALATALHEDRIFLSEFLDWIRVRPPVPANRLQVIEQGLPGDPPQSEEEAQRRGLPDIVIHDGNGWCALIESKVQAPLTDDQLRRHSRTMKRRGFGRIQRVVLTKGAAEVRDAIAISWCGLYEWSGRHQRREWPERLRQYLRAAEVRLSRDGYLDEGTLTMFDGFNFSDDNPYTYGEAKRLLKLAMIELRKSRALRALGMDPKARGRSAITGRDATLVWDFLSLIDRPRGQFTSWPHLTLAVHDHHIEVAVTIPNDVVPEVRRRLAHLGPSGLASMNRQIWRNARRILRRGGWVEAYALQRHYRSQRSAGIVDARMTFKLETGVGAHGIKRQPEWLELFGRLLLEKRANIQFGYIVKMPWDTRGLNSRESLALVAESWCAMKPLLDHARGTAR